MLLPSTSPSSPPTCAWKAQQGSQDGSAALVQQLRGDAPIPGLRDGHGPNEKIARELWAKTKTIAELMYTYVTYVNIVHKFGEARVEHVPII